MKQICGSNRWWIDDAKLSIRRVRKTQDVLKGAFSLLISIAVGFILAKIGTGVDLLRGGVLMVAAFGYGLYSALGAWEVTLHRVSGRLSWRWGLGVPLFQKGRTLTAADHVRLTSLEGATSTRSQSITAHSVEIAGAEGSTLLAGTDNYAEALALAEAVARHTRLGLQVDSGRVRSMSARPQGSEEGSPFSVTRPTAEAPLVRPPELRVPMRAENGQKTLELPALGWAGGYRLQVAVGSGLVLSSLGLCGYMLWLGLPATVVAIWTLSTVMLSALGGNFVMKALVGARTSWRITVSRRGLEVTRFGLWEPSTTRVPVQRIRDIDVRNLKDVGMQVGVFGAPTFPMLVVEQAEGEVLALRAGLSRQELEQTAAWLRQELREKSKDKSQQLSTEAGRALQPMGVGGPG